VRKVFGLLSYGAVKALQDVKAGRHGHRTTDDGAGCGPKMKVTGPSASGDGSEDKPHYREKIDE